MDKTEQLKIYAELQQYGTLWQCIAKDSGEHQKEDIENEALIFVITEWKVAVLGSFDINNAEHRKYLYGAMHKKFVEYSEKNIKYAARIDQPLRNNPDATTHPILLQAKASDAHEPLQQLLDAEDNLITEKIQIRQIAENSFSMVLAYIELFERLKSKTDKHTYLNIAAELKMSYSWLRKCLNRADKFLKTQPSLFDGIESVLVTDKLESWRKVKIIRDSKSAPVVLHAQLSLFQ
ncbi:hypothetical protein [Alkanindiges illinoisensis]|uniref:hypothetical protein n=1 Tax=Alkanindiges illinoisensis TaxID=197183 RepID=UPI000550F427|nr:hypothetical protein [Alkanindiges illinoisensis]